MPRHNSAISDVYQQRNDPLHKQHGGGRRQLRRAITARLQAASRRRAKGKDLHANLGSVRVYAYRSDGTLAKPDLISLFISGRRTATMPSTLTVTTISVKHAIWTSSFACFIQSIISYITHWHCSFQSTATMSGKMVIITQTVDAESKKICRNHIYLR